MNTKKIAHYVKKVKSLPLRVTLKKICTRVAQAAKAFYHHQVDTHYSSFAKDKADLYQPLRYLFRYPARDIFSEAPDWLGGVTRQYLLHRFDLLGSGWVEIYHGVSCRGLESCRFEPEFHAVPDKGGEWLIGRINRANLAEAQRVWKLLESDYQPIDWHLDFKSGYRWCEDTWYVDIEYGHLRGVDVKAPRELARMQHTPQLACAYAAVRKGIKGFETPERYGREFRNQVIDFIATNPPRWGVNWECTMDVAIRIANWLTAYSLFKLRGAQFDEDFENVFARSVYEHGRHIINNLEWSADVRGNHYLSDIVGLLFVSACLPCNRETNAWLALSVQELIKEVKTQFHEDGTNCEASTSYHRLSAELVVYATAVILGLPDEKLQALRNYDHKVITGEPLLTSAPLPFYPLPAEAAGVSPFPYWYFLRLAGMADFVMRITKPDGQVPQIGDNDSGRFLKLSVDYVKMTVNEAKKLYANLSGYDALPDADVYWMENVLNHRHLVVAVNTLVSNAAWNVSTGEEAALEPSIIEALCGGIRVFSPVVLNKEKNPSRIRVGDISDWRRFDELLDQNSLPSVITCFPAPPGADLRDRLETFAYPEFGLYLFKSRRLYLAVRCGPLGIGSHDHNDQLAIELTVDGKTVIADPGTYLYTPLPDRRNEYRSIKAHFAPRVAGKEPGDLSVGLFMLVGEPRAAVLYFGEYGFVGRHEGYGCPVYRRIDLEKDAIHIMDFSPSGKITPCGNRQVSFSPAYGVLQIAPGTPLRGHP